MVLLFTVSVTIVIDAAPLLLRRCCCCCSLLAAVAAVDAVVDADAAVTAAAAVAAITGVTRYKLPFTVSVLTVVDAAASTPPVPLAPLVLPKEEAVAADESDRCRVPLAAILR
jgi:hypothetical protein